MKQLLLLIGFLFCINIFFGQEESEYIEGKISYITSQSVYVKFSTTEHVSIGDTLLIKIENNFIPSLLVKNKSSISCVCNPLTKRALTISETIFSSSKPQINKISTKDSTELAATSVIKKDTIPENKKNQGEIEKKPKQEINGRISISSYTNFSNTPASNSQRMRYTFSLNTQNIANTRLSAETYISFVHRNDNWEEIKEDPFVGLKIYSLALKYDINETTRLVFGRKINPRISSIGAVDGLQFEKSVKKFFFGAFAGSRPDYGDYSYNFNLFQFGAFTGHESQSKNGYSRSTLAFVQQMNNWTTDRRFMYLQHGNTLVKNLSFFGTVEFDLYKATVNQDDSTKLNQQGTFSLTNLFLSLRYRVIRQLTLSFSYSNRQNVIYYETYKNYLERLLDSDPLQGFRFQINYRPIKYMSIGVTTGYRYRQDDPEPSMNLYGYFTYSRIPALNISATVSATLLNTSYLSGRIFSLSLYRDLVSGKLSAGMAYRYIQYDYSTFDQKSIQNIVELNLSWNIYKKLFFSVYYEGAFDQQYTYNRIYMNLTQRF